MSFLLLAVTALHGLVLLLLFVATLDKAWWVLPDQGGFNLWLDCVYLNSSGGWACANIATNPWLRAAQGLVVTSLLLSGVSFGLFGWQLHAGARGKLFALSGGTQLLAGLAVMVGAGLYAAHWPRPPGGHFGHCFVLAWLGGALALVSGATYGHLRKKD